MAKYETVMVFSLKNGAEAAQTLFEKFKTLIEKNGTIVSVDEWGQKNLAYPINDETIGHYVVVNFESEASFPKELSRIFGITEGVLRILTVVQ